MAGPGWLWAWDLCYVQALGGGVVPVFVGGKGTRVVLRLQAGPRQCGHDLGFPTVVIWPAGPSL